MGEIIPSSFSLLEHVLEETKANLTTPVITKKEVLSSVFSAFETNRLIFGLSLFDWHRFAVCGSCGMSLSARSI
jgi:hypothetical protein